MIGFRKFLVSKSLTSLNQCSAVTIISLLCSLQPSLQTLDSDANPLSFLNVVNLYSLFSIFVFLHFRIFDNIRNFKWEGVV